MTALASVFTLNTSAARTRLIGDGLWVALGQGLAALGVLLGMRLLTEVVPPPVFGSVTLLLAIGTLGYNLLCSPLLLAGTRFYSEAAIDDQLPGLRRTLKTLLSRAMLGLVVLSLAATLVSHGPRILSSWTFLSLALLMALDAARALEVNFLIAARRQRPVAIWSAADAWGRPAFAFIAVNAFGVSPQLVLAGYAAASAFCFLIFVCSTAREGVSAQPRSSAAESSLRREILKYALPLIPLALVSWVSSYSDRYVIATVLGVEKVGIFAAAVGLVSRPFLMAGSVVGQTLRPLYFAAVAANNRREGRRVFRLWLAVTAFVSLSGVGAFALLGNWAGEILLAQSYRSGLALFPGIAVGFAFMTLANTFSERFLACKRTGVLTLIQTGMALSYLGLAWPLINRFGLKGAVIAFAFNSFLAVLVLAVAGSQIAAKTHVEAK